MLLLPWLHGEGWGLWTPLIPLWFWSLWEVGGREPLGTAPPYPGLCLHARLPAVYSPVPCLPGGSGCHMGTVPFLGEPVSPPGSQVGIRGLEQPGEGAQGEGGHRWPFSLSGFSKGYSPGWALCLLLLSDTNSCHGWVWDGITLWGHSGSWLWEGGWGMGLPHPGVGGSLIVPNPPPPQLRLTLIGGCGDTGSVPMWLWGSAWYLSLSFWGSGALSDRPPRALLRYVCGWGGGGRARQRCPGLRCCLPGPGL